MPRRARARWLSSVSHWVFKQLKIWLWEVRRSSQRRGLSVVGGCRGLTRVTRAVSRVVHHGRLHWAHLRAVHGALS
jgi:hypothetical protein